jgi:hypothetical protein
MDTRGNSMQFAAQERASRSRQHLTLQWGPALKSWASTRAAAWRLGQHCPPLELLARIEKLRAGAPWDLLEKDGADVRLADLIICSLSGCGWHDQLPPPEWTREHSLQELVRRATLEVPGLKPARVRHLLARDVKAGRLQRIARGRYAAAPWQWQHLEPEDRFELHEDDERSWARFERARKNRADVLLLHYLLPRLQAYRKSKALGIGERTYYDRLAHAVENFGMVFRPRAMFARNVQS